MLISPVYRFMAVLALLITAAAPPSPAQAAPITAVAVTGQGEYTNSEKLLIDGVIPAQESSFDDPACVFWFGTGVSFVIDLGAAYQVEGITLQGDNNDDYRIEASLDGSGYSTLLTLPGDLGEVDGGMETVSTDKTDPQFLPGLRFVPMPARYLRLSASGGDEVYAVSEVKVHGVRLQNNLTGLKAAAQPVPLTAQRSVPPGQAAGDMERIFNAMDTNHDNRVSMAEYDAIWRDKQNVAENFRFFDRDGSGFIERQEYLGLADLKQRPGKKVPSSGSAPTPLPSPQSPTPPAASNAGVPAALQGGISLQLDPVKVENALAALKERKSATDAMAAGRLRVMDEYVARYHFENWFDLSFYMNQVCVIGTELMSNKEAKAHLNETYGAESVEIIARPASLNQIRSYCEM